MKLFSLSGRERWSRSSRAAWNCEYRWHLLSVGWLEKRERGDGLTCHPGHTLHDLRRMTLAWGVHVIWTDDLCFVPCGVWYLLVITFGHFLPIFDNENEKEWHVDNNISNTFWNVNERCDKEKDNQGSRSSIAPEELYLEGGGHPVLAFRQLRIGVNWFLLFIEAHRAFFLSHIPRALKKRPHFWPLPIKKLGVPVTYFLRKL